MRVTDHVTSTWPAGSERLPCLLALVTSSCTAMLRPKVGSGSRKTFGPLNDMRSRNGASSVLSSSLSEVDFHPPSVMRRCALASASTRASYFVDQIGNAARILGGLREQGQQLREQISRAVTQLADHQFMTLVQLPALDGPRHHVRYRGQKRHVIVVKLAPFFRVRAEHAIGPAVAAGDRRGDAR